MIGISSHAHKEANDMTKPTDTTSPADFVPSTGGGACVRVYAADAVITVDPDSTLLAVADELANDQVGLVVLGSMTDVEGVISERDVVRGVADGRDPLVTPARELASTKVVWCDASATVREVAERMMEEYVRHALLEEDGRLVGIVSARDLLSAYAMQPD
jgi:CBS domain-containing protein